MKPVLDLIGEWESILSFLILHSWIPASAGMTEKCVVLPLRYYAILVFTHYILHITVSTLR